MHSGICNIYDSEHWASTLSCFWSSKATVFVGVPGLYYKIGGDDFTKLSDFLKLGLAIVYKCTQVEKMAKFLKPHIINLYCSVTML